MIDFIKKYCARIYSLIVLGLCFFELCIIVNFNKTNIFLILQCVFNVVFFLFWDYHIP